MSKKVIVITGAAGGVGQMLAKGLAQGGHHIVCLGRTTDALEKVTNEINTKVRASGAQASYHIVDMMDDKSVRVVGEDIFKSLGGIDVWINNVGVNNHNAIGPTWTLIPENWWHEVSQNLYTCMVGTHTAINLMKEKNHGYIINLGGGGVQKPKPYGSAYGAAKTAIVKFTETIQIELQKEGLDIKVFAFNPGFIRNTRTAKLVASEVVTKYMPELAQIFYRGDMSNIEDSLYLIEKLINGEADQLAGQYFFADDKNIDQAIEHSAQFVEEKRNVLRVR